MALSTSNRNATRIGQDSWRIVGAPGFCSDWKLDRIARSLKDLLSIQERIIQAGADFKSLTETLDTSTPAGRMIFQLLGAFAEFERELIRERTKVGLRAAMERGSKPERTPARDESGTGIRIA